ncbi:hypothetical protein MMOR_39180 [Mycolicibacterium moriokaense]|uniref:Uncharacterized protein n=1 Tax=Mycolicibacterium moriokaense TaxID=39691 RepID=A0AAD1HCT1_9MYCO|nr:hypothetical protein MMOR_39180 [Mycolicibacterium moriokaense]
MDIEESFDNTIHLVGRLVEPTIKRIVSETKAIPPGCCQLPVNGTDGQVGRMRGGDYHRRAVCNRRTPVT